MNVVAGVSVVMCVLSCLLWKRSYERADAIRWIGRMFEIGDVSKLRVVMVYSGQGCIEVAVARDGYWSARDTAIANPWVYATEDKPGHPSMTAVDSGSKRTFDGFYPTGGDWGPPATTA